MSRNKNLLSPTCEKKKNKTPLEVTWPSFIIYRVTANSLCIYSISPPLTSPHTESRSPPPSSPTQSDQMNDGQQYNETAKGIYQITDTIWFSSN